MDLEYAELIGEPHEMRAMVVMLGDGRKVFMMHWDPAIAAAMAVEASGYTGTTCAVFDGHAMYLMDWENNG